MTSVVLGFNGERLDPLSGATLLGNGYRAYSSTQRRFHRPDDLSPFGGGGINPYIYCGGDPVNRADPSGHLSWQAGLGIGFGVLGVVGAVFTAGASLAAAGSLSAALASVSAVSLGVAGSALVADIAGIASGAVEQSAPAVSAALGWFALAAGVLSLGIGLGARMAQGVARRLSAGTITAGVGASQAVHYDIPGALRGERQFARSVQVIGTTSGSKLAYLWVDTKNGLDRLNIYAHGTVSAGGRPWVMINKGMSNGEKLAEIIKTRVPGLVHYRNIRLMICHSGDSTARFRSVAEDLAQHLPPGHSVTGFKGVVTMRPDTNWMRLQREGYAKLIHEEATAEQISDWIMAQQERGDRFVIRRRPEALAFWRNGVPVVFNSG